jgi:hypothetical protein
VGNITEQKYKHGTSSEKDMDYVYDNRYRLKTFKFGGVTQRSYTYDDNGNFKTFASRTCTYGNDNNQLTNDGSRSYTFDESGRVKQIASTAMTYDIFNNMLAYGSDSYSYDDANPPSTMGSVSSAYERSFSLDGLQEQP